MKNSRALFVVPFILEKDHCGGSNNLLFVSQETKSTLAQRLFLAD